MAKVLCISSQTVWGPVGNSAAVPALQSLGHEVLQIPTVLLSNHPGHGKPSGQSTPPSLLELMLLKLLEMQALQDCDAVMTGYFASAEQVAVVAKHVKLLRDAKPHLRILVDPVIGDNGALYVGEDVAATLRDKLLPLATIATPNLFELNWLTGTTDIEAAYTRLNISELVVTSVPKPENQLATQLLHGPQRSEFSAPHLAHVPHGTGDFLAGLYLAYRLTSTPEQALAAAHQRLQTAIAKSAGSNVLCVS